MTFCRLDANDLSTSCRPGSMYLLFAGLGCMIYFLQVWGVFFASCRPGVYDLLFAGLGCIDFLFADLGYVIYFLQA